MIREPICRVTHSSTMYIVNYKPVLSLYDFTLGPDFQVMAQNQLLSLEESRIVLVQVRKEMTVAVQKAWSRPENRRGSRCQKRTGSTFHKKTEF